MIKAFEDGIKFNSLESTLKNSSIQSNKEIHKTFKEYHFLAKKYDIPKERLKEISLLYLRSIRNNGK